MKRKNSSELLNNKKQEIINKSLESLPIFGYKSEIIKTVLENDVIPFKLDLYNYWRNRLRKIYPTPPIHLRLSPNPKTNKRNPNATQNLHNPAQKSSSNFYGKKNLLRARIGAWRGSKLRDKI